MPIVNDWVYVWMKDGALDRNQDFGIQVVQKCEDHMTVLEYLVLK